MVSAKLLGILDLIALAAITLVFLDVSPAKTAFFAFFYLLVKGLIFRFDFNSYMDIGIAIYVILLMLGFKLSFVYVFVLIYLGQKGVISLI